MTKSKRQGYKLGTTQEIGDEKLETYHKYVGTGESGSDLGRLNRQINRRR